MLKKTFTLPAGADASRRLVVIGDVHGEAFLFAKALDSIESPETAVLLLTGDLIDRGPNSKACLVLANAARERFKEVITLPGNHEQMAWLAAKDLEGPWAGVFGMNGGSLTLHEFGYDMNALMAAIPAEMIQRLEGDLPVWHREGDLLIVHAGVDPEVDTLAFLSEPSDPQLPPGRFVESASPLWIRGPFYANHNHSGPYKAPNGDPVLVVYGHTRIGTRDKEEILRRVGSEIENWRFPVDVTNSGTLLIAEFNGAEATVTLI